ncbi:MAG: 2TM domain-containing protein [Alphaproteobacteria bacterium]
MSAEPARGDERQGARRLRGFLNHLIGYFAVMVVLVPVNLYAAPETPWFLVPMVGWGAALAVHAAYAMGLLGRGPGGTRAR